MVFGTRKELKSVSAAKVSALIGWLCLENKDRFGAYVFDGTQNSFFKASNSRGNMIAILKKISTYTQQILSPGQAKSESLFKPIKLLSQTLKGHATVFIVSDFSDFSDKVQKSLAELSRKCQVFCIDVFDTLEAKAPPSGEYMVSSGSGKSLIFNTTSKEFRAEYQEYFASRRQEIKEFCRRFGARYIAINGETELYRQLQII